MDRGESTFENLGIELLCETDYSYSFLCKEHIGKEIEIAFLEDFVRGHFLVGNSWAYFGAWNAFDLGVWDSDGFFGAAWGVLKQIAGWLDVSAFQVEFLDYFLGQIEGEEVEELIGNQLLPIEVYNSLGHFENWSS